VIDELRKSDWASRTVREKARRIQTTMMELEQRSSTPPTEKEIAGELNISLEEYQRWLEEVRPVTFVCLDSAASASDEDSRALAEIVSDPGQDTPLDTLERRDLADLIAKRIKSLPDMQRKVLALYYVEDLRLREIAEAFGVTESRISQVHAQAILSIRSFLEKAERGSEAMPIFRK
jgi:RNA polymerase sigma factor for flagellar operon FliA